jgi:hypothetical protein
VARRQSRRVGVFLFGASELAEMLTQRWKVEVGLGYATPLIVGNRVYVFSRQGENEGMSALDSSTGKQIWRSEYPVRFDMHKAASRHGAGPKAPDRLRRHD